MTAVAIRQGETLTPATVLPDVSSAAAVAELTEALGRPPKPSEMTRLHRRPDMTFVMSYRTPTIDRSELGALDDRPWSYAGGLGMRAITAWGSIRYVVELILNPTSGDSEVRRREHLHEQMLGDLAARHAREEADRRAAGAAEAEERRRQEEARRLYGWSSWGLLPPVAKLAFWLALVISDGEDLSTALRRLGGELAQSGTLPFPGRKWR